MLVLSSQSRATPSWIHQAHTVISSHTMPVGQTQTLVCDTECLGGPMLPPQRPSKPASLPVHLHPHSRTFRICATYEETTSGFLLHSPIPLQHLWCFYHLLVKVPGKKTVKLLHILTLVSKFVSTWNLPEHLSWSSKVHWAGLEQNAVQFFYLFP